MDTKWKIPYSSGYARLLLWVIVLFCYDMAEITKMRGEKIEAIYGGVWLPRVSLPTLYHHRSWAGSPYRLWAAALTSHSWPQAQAGTVPEAPQRLQIQDADVRLTPHSLQQETKLFVPKLEIKGLASASELTLPCRPASAGAWETSNPTLPTGESSRDLRPGTLGGWRQMRGEAGGRRRKVLWGRTSWAQECGSMNGL